MVHIEVYLGGENPMRSIGSRTSINEVSYHDNFKFVAANYGNIKYHYRSLDTWLDGVCKSWCPDHTWKCNRYAVTEGNNHGDVISLLLKRGMLEIGREMRRSEFVRLRWTLKPSEVNWR